MSDLPTGTPSTALPTGAGIGEVPRQARGRSSSGASSGASKKYAKGAPHYRNDSSPDVALPVRWTVYRAGGLHGNALGEVGGSTHQRPP
jgi:hypothetical protein